MRIFKNILFFLPMALFISCSPQEERPRTQKSTIFIGVDISGSFTKTKRFRNGMKFLGQYISAHLENQGGLAKPVDLYVGGIGGNREEDPQDFFPIHDFVGLTPSAIESKLLQEFAKKRDNLTDFNTFFKRISSLIKQKNLVLAPLDVIMITDGVPEVADQSSTSLLQAYKKIDLSPLENITRNVNIRMLYSGPRVGELWRKYVPTKRIKIWTVEPNVMFGWNNQISRNGSEGLYTWIRDNIDLRIKSR